MSRKKGRKNGEKEEKISEKRKRPKCDEVRGRQVGRKKSIVSLDLKWYVHTKFHPPKNKKIKKYKNLWELLLNHDRNNDNQGVVGVNRRAREQEKRRHGHLSMNGTGNTPLPGGTVGNKYFCILRDGCIWEEKEGKRKKGIEKKKRRNLREIKELIRTDDKRKTEKRKTEKNRKRKKRRKIKGKSEFLIYQRGIKGRSGRGRKPVCARYWSVGLNIIIAVAVVVCSGIGVIIVVTVVDTAAAVVINVFFIIIVIITIQWHWIVIILVRVDCVRYRRRGMIEISFSIYIIAITIVDIVIHIVTTTTAAAATIKTAITTIKILVILTGRWEKRFPYRNNTISGICY